jgi:2-iminobutanoate/2-iminopropanoate deaminase
MKKCSIVVFLLITGNLIFAQMPDKQVVYTEKAPKPIGPYSQGIMAGNTLYISGQIAINPESLIMDTATIESEIRQVLENFGAVLNQAGMSYEHVVKTTIYTTDLKNFKTINAIYGRYFKDKQPARETVQVVALPGKAHIEISGIAVKKPEVKIVPVREGNE